MFNYQVFDFFQLVRGESLALAKPDRVHPKLGLVLFAAHMDVHRLVTLVAEKRKPVRGTRNLNRWHEIKMAAAS
jgi:hypothetical protein